MDSTLRDLWEGVGDSTALVDKNGSWTRDMVRDGVLRAAGALREKGINPGDRVAVVVGNSAETVVGLLASRALGALVCPMEPARVSSLVSLIKPRIVLADKAVDGFDSVSVGELLATGQPIDAPVAQAQSWGFATSGTSGGGLKVVCLTETSVSHVTSAVHEVVPYNGRDRVLSTLPLYHTYGLSQLWLTLRAGATLMLPGAPLLPGDLKRWLADATVYPTVAGTFRRLVDLKIEAPLRLVTLAGQATLESDRVRFVAAFPQTDFVVYHGLTEATTRILWLKAEEFLTKPRATGRPIPGVHAWLDEEGVLWCDGPNVAAGYLDDEETTRKTFPDGKLKSGDVFAMDGDLFCFQGRRDGVFKRWGEKVVPELVEGVLRQHPEVVDCLVLASDTVNSDPDVVAWVVPEAAQSHATSILGLARRQLPSALVPSKIEFVAQLDRTSSGKVIRRVPSTS